MNTKFIGSGVALMVTAALMLIFLDPTAIRILGTGLIFVIGLGLAVAGSPDSER